MNQQKTQNVKMNQKEMRSTKNKQKQNAKCVVKQTKWKQ